MGCIKYDIVDKIDETIFAIRLAESSYISEKSKGLDERSSSHWREVRLNAKMLQEKVSLLIKELANV